jgi:hypothetical protein
LLSLKNGKEKDFSEEDINITAIVNEDGCIVVVPSAWKLSSLCTGIHTSSA